MVEGPEGMGMVMRPSSRWMRVVTGAPLRVMCQLG